MSINNAILPSTYTGDAAKPWIARKGPSGACHSGLPFPSYATSPNSGKKTKRFRPSVAGVGVVGPFRSLNVSERALVMFLRQIGSPVAAS